MIADNEHYSQRGLRLLSPTLKQLNPLSLTVEQQHEEAIARAGKMSIQGVQIKLSAVLNKKHGHFEVVDNHGDYILKMQNASYPEMPENEALTMSLAETIGLKVPVHGLIYGADGKFVYFVKRFDRLPKKKKLAMEDFAQLSGFDRETKYNSSIEQVVHIINQYCTYPKVEFVTLLKLTLFNFLVGNEDMHLKNFSLITKNGKTTLSPMYDLLSTTIAMTRPSEEMALPMKGRKSNLTSGNFLDYFAKDRLGLNQKTIDQVCEEIKSQLPRWREMIAHSFLSEPMKEKYLELLSEREKRLNLSVEG
ncbi:MAG TPA: HipA domain-containing protein [Gammaproteobacteria bacterium]|nr:HipA domain-containing protein [Gammaproteobacteria bacterium]